ncbi:MAG TPA: 50S ribosomal protein L9 [Verrucomicrobiae bacterium]|nr:50S ribosomal protein L9 [Verrucomicrobiae bacterium]
MRIILREDVEKLGRRGEVVKVAPGYGRNYLLPKGLAYLHTAGNEKRVEQERRFLNVKLAKEKQAAEDLARRISQLSLTIVRKVGENETLYGSVTNGDIGEALEKEGFGIDKRKILLEEPIKTLGIYTVAVRLHADVNAELKVWVVKE